MNPDPPFGDVPVVRWLGLRRVLLSADRVQVAMEARTEFAQDTGLIQGGILTALADAAAAQLVLHRAADRTSATGTSLDLDFLRPARPGGETLLADARMEKDGRTLARVRVEVAQGDRTVLVGTFRFLRFGVADRSD